MATQSSISVRGSSEQKVPSVRKGGRGGGGNRNSGGGPGHSGHSVLSSVSSSSILHLSVLKTTWKINARLILLTELLIGTWEKLYLLPKAAPPLVIYSSSFPLACRSSFQLARHRSFFFHFFSLLRVRVVRGSNVFLGTLETELHSVFLLSTLGMPCKTPARKTIYVRFAEISLLGGTAIVRTWTGRSSNERQRRRVKNGRRGKKKASKRSCGTEGTTLGRRSDKLVSNGYRRGKTGGGYGGGLGEARRTGARDWSLQAWERKNEKGEMPVDRESSRPGVKLITGQAPNGGRRVDFAG